MLSFIITLKLFYTLAFTSIGFKWPSHFYFKVLSLVSIYKITTSSFRQITYAIVVLKKEFPVTELVSKPSHYGNRSNVKCEQRGIGNSSVPLTRYTLRPF